VVLEGGAGTPPATHLFTEDLRDGQRGVQELPLSRLNELETVAASGWMMPHGAETATPTPTATATATPTPTADG
jgi:hypothetical protein